MEQLSGFAYFPVQFTKDAVVHDQTEVTRLKEFLRQDRTTDLIVISHGWNNNMDQAKDLYAKFFANFRSALTSDRLRGSRTVGGPSSACCGPPRSSKRRNSFRAAPPGPVRWSEWPP